MYERLKETALLPDLIKSAYPTAFEDGEHRGWHQDTRIANAFLNLMHLAWVQKLGWIVELKDVTFWKPDGMTGTTDKHAHVKLDVFATGLGTEAHAAYFTMEYKDGCVWMYQIKDRTIEYAPDKKNSIFADSKKHPMTFLVTKCSARWDKYYERGEWVGFDDFYEHGFAPLFNALLKCKSLQDRIKANADVIKDRDKRAKANAITAAVPTQMACELEEIINERYGKHYHVGLKRVITSSYTKYKLQIGNCLASTLHDIWYRTSHISSTARSAFVADNVKNLDSEWMVDPEDNVQMFHGKSNAYCKLRIESVHELVKESLITDLETLKALDDEYKYFLNNFNKEPICPVPPLLTCKYNGYREFDLDNTSSALEVCVSYHHGNERSQRWSIEIGTTLPSHVGVMFRSNAYFDGSIEVFRRHINEWLDAEEKAYFAMKAAMSTISQESDYILEAAKHPKTERYLTSSYLLS